MKAKSHQKAQNSHTTLGCGLLPRLEIATWREGSKLLGTPGGFFISQATAIVPYFLRIPVSFLLAYIH